MDVVDSGDVGATDSALGQLSASAVFMAVSPCRSFRQDEDTYLLIFCQYIE